MSYRFLNAAWELELPAHLKIVLLSLADQANDDGECWPSQHTISRRCGTSTRQVSTNLRKLRTLGHVEMVKRRRRKTAVYRLLLLDQKPTSDQEDLQDRKPTSGDKPQDRKPTAVKTGSPLPTNHKRTTTTTEPPTVSGSAALAGPHLDNAAPAVARHDGDVVFEQFPVDYPLDEAAITGHEVEVVERDGHTYEVEIKQRSPHDAMTYGIVAAMGWEPGDVTEPQWGAIHKAAKELLRRGATTAEVMIRAKAYQLNHPDWSLTPSALVKWWADSADVRAAPSPGQVADLKAAAERRNWRNR